MRALGGAQEGSSYKSYSQSALSYSSGALRVVLVAAATVHGAF